MKLLEIDRQQRFLPEEYYVWFLEGSKVKSFLGGILMVSIILAGVMFPLWPTSLRIGVWYLSMAMLGVIALFFGLAIFRLIFYVITIVAAKPGIWIFPNLFADVGFVGCICLSTRFCIADALDPPGGQLYSRMGLGSATAKEEEGVYHVPRWYAVAG